MMSEFAKTKLALRETYNEQRRVCRLRLRDLKGLLRYVVDDESKAALECAVETEQRLLLALGELEGAIRRIGGTANAG